MGQVTCLDLFIAQELNQNYVFKILLKNRNIVFTETFNKMDIFAPGQKNLDIFRGIFSS